MVLAPSNMPAWSPPDGERIYAIGDIHGSADLLERLLDRIASHNTASPLAHTTIVFLGDYIDRGLKSSTVLARLRTGLSFAHRTIFLAGNHEEMLLTFLDDASYAAQWRHFGGVETLASYGVDVRPLMAGRGFDDAQRQLVQRMPPADLEFIAGLHQSFSCGDYFFCHAGIRPGVPMGQQSRQDLLWIREDFLNSTHDFQKCVVHGHTPVKSPDVRANRINIDTGAYATGVLTAAVLEGRSQDFIAVSRTR